MPGKQNLSIIATIVIGIVGSFVGGFLGYLIFRSDRQDGFFQPSGIIGSIGWPGISLCCSRSRRSQWLRRALMSSFFVILERLLMPIFFALASSSLFGVSS